MMTWSFGAKLNDVTDVSKVIVRVANDHWNESHFWICQLNATTSEPRLSNFENQKMRYYKVLLNNANWFSEKQFMNFSFGILKLVSYKTTFDPMCRDHLYYHSLHHFSMILVLSVVYWVLGLEWGEGGGAHHGCCSRSSSSQLFILMSLWSVWAKGKLSWTISPRSSLCAYRCSFGLLKPGKIMYQTSGNPPPILLMK